MSIQRLLVGLLSLGPALAWAEFERVQYNNPGLVVDVGVGLWAWPLPMDWDEDGDQDEDEEEDEDEDED